MANKKDWAMRNAHIQAIKSMKIDIDERIGIHSYFALDERVKKLQSDLHKFEAKNLAIICADTSVDFDENTFATENDAINNLVMDLKATIREKMAQLNVDKGESNTLINRDETVVGATNNAIENISDSGKDKLVVAETEESLQKQAKKNALSAAMASLKFSVAEWHSFEEEYITKIKGNDTLLDEEKFSVLLNACASTEAMLVLSRSGETNSEIAFKSLKQKYGSAYAQANFFVNTLMHMQELIKPFPMQIASMINTVEYCMIGIERHLGKSDEKIIPFMVIDKFGGAMRGAWERYENVLALSCKQKDPIGEVDAYLPDWKAIKGFLQSEAEFSVQFGVDDDDVKAKCETHTGDMYSTRTGKQNVVNQPGKNVQSTVSNESKAASSKKAVSGREAKPNEFCRCDFWHPIHKCKEFIKLNMNGREEYIREWKICGQCLCKEHMGTSCVDPLANRFCNRCHPEKKKHNSLLCVVKYKMMNSAASQLGWNDDENW